MNKSAVFAAFLVFLLSFFLCNGAHVSSVGAASKSEKADDIRYAISKQILSAYDIPFHVYVNHEMWPEIYAILNANLKNMLKRRLPDQYYSKPVIFKNRILVFENNASPDGFLEFDMDTLASMRQTKNDASSPFSGGIRKIHNGDIILGAFFQQPDDISIYSPETGNTLSLRLREGRYVTAINVFNNTLYAGSCGGFINAWQYEDGLPAEIYRTHNTESETWVEFNAAECLTALSMHENRLYAAGERAVYAWDIGDPLPIQRLKKRIPAGFNHIFNDHFIEYKDRTIYLHHLKEEKASRKLAAPGIIQDLIVTSEKMLPQVEGPLLIASLKHNQGIIFHDIETLRQALFLHLPGEALTASRQALYATDDDHLYKYSFGPADPEGYLRFVASVDLDKIDFNAHPPEALIQKLGEFPEFVTLSGLHHRWLARKRIDFEADIHQKAASNGTADEKTIELQENSFRLRCRLRNQGDTMQLLTMRIQWAETGDETDGGVNGAASAAQDSGVFVHRVPEHNVDRTLFLPPGGGAKTIDLQLGKNAMAAFYAYPVRIDAVSKSFYAKFQKALSEENSRPSLIDRYLQDDRLREWHPELQARKRKILEENKKKPWIIRFFLNSI